MKTKIVIGVAVLAGTALSVSAQNVFETGTTRMIFEVSTDGSNWQSHATVNPGVPVAFRIRFVYTGSESVSKLVEARYQPLFSNWRDSDSLAPFYNNGGGTNTTTPVGALPATNSFPTQCSKVFPFASISQTSSGAGLVTSFRHNIDGVSYLRIAGANATNWVGTPVSINSNNNTNGLWGVISSQRAQNLDPNSTMLGTDVTVYKGSFTPGASSETERLMRITTSPLALQRITGGPNANYRGVLWIRAISDSVTGDVRSSVIISDATVTVIPSPGIATLLTIGALPIARGRRPRTE